VVPGDARVIETDVALGGTADEYVPVVDEGQVQQRWFVIALLQEVEEPTPEQHACRESNIPVIPQDGACDCIAARAQFSIAQGLEENLPVVKVKPGVPGAYAGARYVVLAGRVAADDSWPPDGNSKGAFWGANLDPPPSPGTEAPWQLHQSLLAAGDAKAEAKGADPHLISSKQRDNRPRLEEAIVQTRSIGAAQILDRYLFISDVKQTMPAGHGVMVQPQVRLLAATHQQLARNQPAPQPGLFGAGDVQEKGGARCQHPFHDSGLLG